MEHRTIAFTDTIIPLRHDCFIINIFNLFEHAINCLKTTGFLSFDHKSSTYIHMNFSCLQWNLWHHSEWCMRLVFSDTGFVPDPFWTDSDWDFCLCNNACFFGWWFFLYLYFYTNTIIYTSILEQVLSKHPPFNTQCLQNLGKVGNGVS